MTDTKTTTVRNAFTGLRGTYRAIIDSAGIAVWDSVAGHYTKCHNLTDRQIRAALRRLA